MNTFKKLSLASAVACTMALASQAAPADLIITANGTQVADDTSNTVTSYSGTTGGFTINVLTAAGVTAFGNSGNLFDVGSLNISTAGGGALTLLFTETNLTSSAASQAFQLDFSGVLSGVSVTRSVYFDGTNSALETSLLGSTTGGNSSFLSAPVSISGPFSLTEEIDVTANPQAQGATLSSDDKIMVPEPAALSLMGLGLSALAFARRRKTI